MTATCVAGTAPCASSYRVEPADAARVAELAGELGPPAHTDADEFCARARLLARQLPERLSAALLRFGEFGSESGIFVVQGLEVTPDGTALPPTPLHNRSGLGAGTGFAAQVALVAHLLGELVYYQAEGTGHLAQDMVPNPEFARRQSSQGSGAELEAHTEQSFSPMRPDYVVLGCLRGDPDAYTFVLPARVLAEHFDADEIAYLRRPLWTTLIDDSFHPYVPDPDEIRGPFALLSGPAEDPELRVDQELTHGMTARAEQLLHRLLEVYRTHKRGFALAAGEIGFVDNTRAMHGRSSFTPRFDGTDRFVVRTFVVRDLRRTSVARRPGGRRIAAAAS